MKIFLSILILTVLCLSAKAQINYDYIELGYKKVDYDPYELNDDNTNLMFNDFDVDGITFEGSFSFGRNYFVYADFDVTSTEIGNNLALGLTRDFGSDFGINLSAESEVDLTTQVLGVGYHTDGDIQFVAKAGILRHEIDSSFVKLATVGYDIELGGRRLFSDSFEWEANLQLTDRDAGDGRGGEIGVNTAFRYHFGSKFSTDFSASIAEDEMTYGLNFRFNFSR